MTGLPCCIGAKPIPFSEASPSPSVGAVGVKNFKTGEVDTAFLIFRKASSCSWTTPWEHLYV